jgi:integrase/recombinase XerD
VPVKVVPDLRRAKAGGKYPLKLRVTYKGERKYYNTIYDLTVPDWEIMNSEKAKGKLRLIRNDISKLENDASTLIQNMGDFSFAKFEKKFFINATGFGSLKSAFGDYISQISKEGRAGTVDSYQTALNSLISYKGDIRLAEINVDYLQGFEKYLVSKNRSYATVGIYLRPLRAVLNIAISEGYLSKDDYPFGKRRYVIPTGNNIKKAIGIEEIGKIFNYKCSSETHEDRSRDFWMFSYLCNGMNVMDVARIKIKNLSAEELVFFREKTKNTTKSNPRPIRVLRCDIVNKIIKKWGKTRSINPESYLFDIIETGDSAETIKKKVKQFTQVTNHWMKKMGESLKIEVKLTTYVARHSFATILAQDGLAPVKYITDKLGHSSIGITEKYLGGFDIKQDKLYSKVLTAF